MKSVEEIKKEIVLSFAFVFIFLFSILFSFCSSSSSFLFLIFFSCSFCFYFILLTSTIKSATAPSSSYFLSHSLFFLLLFPISSFSTTLLDYNPIFFFSFSLSLSCLFLLTFFLLLISSLFYLFFFFPSIYFSLKAGPQLLSLSFLFFLGWPSL